MNRLAVARTALAEALNPVLNGRVLAYPPTAGRAPAPSVWIEQPTVARVSSGNTRLVVATFPVWMVADGAERPAVAVLDDLVAQVWDQVDRLGHNTPGVARPAVYTRQDNSTPPAYRAAVLDVDVTVGAVSLCLPPSADSVQVPPMIPTTEET